jgi:hypothetical protein
LVAEQGLQSRTQQNERSDRTPEVEKGPMKVEDEMMEWDMMDEHMDVEGMEHRYRHTEVEDKDHRGRMSGVVEEGMDG